MAVKIKKVAKLSKAHICGIRPGDLLLSVDGNEIMDILDYDFYVSENKSEMTFKKANGQKKTITASKDNCGLEFESYLMDEQKGCLNKCIFCFVDQLPKGLRQSLYFKDDDSRLSFLFGNYITLTNISEHEIERIIDMHISPINISVHTMNPELRVQMMKNKNAGKSLDIMRRFADAGIKMNTQLVLCPGINDGDELKYSIEKLSEMFPAVCSIAAVPVGLTKFRDGLCPLKAYDSESAGHVIDIINEYSLKFREKYGTGLVYPADEFFIKAGREIPKEDYYDDYPQIENGVGMVRSFSNEFIDELEDNNEIAQYSKLSVACGTDIYPVIKELCAKAEEKYITKIRVYPIANHFFGETITVTGLLTGNDIIDQLKDKSLGERLVLSNTLISDYTNLTENKNKLLDDVTIEEIEEKLNVKISLSLQNGSDFLKTLLGVK